MWQNVQDNLYLQVNSMLLFTSNNTVAVMTSIKFTQNWQLLPEHIRTVYEKPGLKEDHEFAAG